MGVYNREMSRKKERKHAFDQAKKVRFKKKRERNTHCLSRKKVIIKNKRKKTTKKKVRKQDFNHAIDQEKSFKILLFFLL